MILARPDDPRRPLWVFTYGDLCAWRQFGDFRGDPLDRARRAEAGTEIVQRERQVMVGAPSEAYLPAYARAIVGAYLVSVGVERPAVRLVSDPARGAQDLMLSFGLADFPDRARLDAIMGRLSWFFPRGRSFLLRVDALADGPWTPLGSA